MTQRTKIILGPPGTGKTSYLLDVMDKELAAGVSPHKIAFCSFTKKSLEEAVTRACERFNFDRPDLPYFRTIHSMAFMSLGLTKDQVLSGLDYKKIGDHLGIAFTGKYDPELDAFGYNSKNNGDRYMFIDGFSRARRCSPKVVWDMITHDGLNWFEFERYASTVVDYKRDHNKYDFADMLEKGARPINVDVLIIDEAQDLSTAQWKFINESFKKAKRVYIGGDDDQAIFEWSGADVNMFINLKGERTVLTESYRIPKKVHSLAEGISGRITNRSVKSYQPRSKDGEVEYWADLQHIDFSSGTWLLLARNTYMLGEMAATIRNCGYCYTLKGTSSVSKTCVEAIELWGKHVEGLALSKKEQDKLMTYTSSLDKKTIWHEAFDKMQVESKEYYISLLRRGESLKKEPRIAVSTIHGSKGGEADNVVLLTDMVGSTWEGMPMNPNAEHRVWYVGVTRCRNSLHIVSPRSRYFYDL